jgi:branched-chain amino acid transport system substrate-binding protein
MKSKKWFKLSFLILAFIILISLIVSCGKPQSSSISSASTTASASTTNTAAGPAKTLKLGLVFWLGSDVGLDAVHAIELMVEEDNKNGGITIGGEQYKVQLIQYDSENNQTTETAAINRLIFEDKVQYILTQGMFQGAWLQTTESNKVIVMSGDGNFMVDLAPTTHYSFNPTFQNTSVAAKIGWFCKTYPDMAQNMVIAFIDNQFGHMISGLAGAMFKSFGVTPTVIYFPANQQDLSSVGTKIVSLTPKCVMCMSGTSQIDALVYNAIYQAGYRGQFFMTENASYNTYLQFMSPEVLDGFIYGMYPTEMEPALTQSAQEFKKLWVNKYGEWTDPMIVSTPTYSCLKAALIKAGSINTDTVSNTIGSGFSYTSPTGDGNMISRSDIGNNRTVDSISTYYMKQIVNGKPTLLATISVEEATKYFLTANPPLPAGAAPPGPPGP